jgi:tetratricopeptide (TPR) repeat protein
MVNIIDYLLADSGLLVRSREVSEGEWAETLRAHRLDAPRNIRQMIERNLERLKPEDQAVLEGASAVGAEFSAAVVAAALDRSQDEVEMCCLRLSRREQFVSAQSSVAWPDGTVAAGFRFHHALYQEVLYDLLPTGRRIQLHRRIAEREETGYGNRAHEVATQLAHHYTRANEKTKAIQYFRLAGERAAARGAALEAEDHYRRALELLAKLPQAIERDRLELALQVALGSVLWGSRSWSHPEAAHAYVRAQELAETLEETTQLVEVLKGLMLSALGRGHFKLARELGERFLEAAERGGERGALCAAYALMGHALLRRAEYIDAQKHFELAENNYDENDRRELASTGGTHAPAGAAIVALLLGFPDRARKLMNQALRRAQDCDHSFFRGLVHMWAGRFYWLLRDAREVLEHAQELSRLAAKQPVWNSVAGVNTGRTLMLQGCWEEAANYLRRGNALHKSTGLASQLIRAKLDEAEMLAHQGRIDAGLALIAEALADSEELAEIRSPALRQRAELLAQSAAEAPAVEVAYRSAIECARAQGAKYYELQATTSLARWLKSQRRFEEARTMLAAIYNWFTEGFDTVALREAKALLENLRDESGTPRRSGIRRKGR